MLLFVSKRQATECLNMSSSTLKRYRRSVNGLRVFTGCGSTVVVFATILNY